MSAEDNRRTYIHVWDEILNRGNLDVVDRFMTADVVMHHPLTPAQGREAVRRTMGARLDGFSDFVWTVEDSFAAGNRVAVRFTTSITHTGEYNGIAPTGKRIAFSGNNIARFEDGCIAEEWMSLDALGFLRQLGAVPE